VTTKSPRHTHLPSDSSRSQLAAARKRRVASSASLDTSLQFPPERRSKGTSVRGGDLAPAISDVAGADCVRSDHRSRRAAAVLARIIARARAESGVVVSLAWSLIPVARSSRRFDHAGMLIAARRPLAVGERASKPGRNRREETSGRNE